MPRTTDWRSQDAVDALLELDRPDLAWEFLRRNPDYREDFRQTLQRIALNEISEDAAAHKFLTPVFGPDAIEKTWFESGPHGFDVESVGQIALLAELNQFGFEICIRLRIGRLQDQISRMRRGRTGGSSAAVSVRSWKVTDGLTSD